MSKKSAGFALIIPVALLAVLTGCLVPTQPLPPPPPPEAVLEGRWELTGDMMSDDVSAFFISFDANGNISRLDYRVGSARVVFDEPDFIQTDSTVNGSSVSIIATWFGVNNLAFSGTANAGFSRIDGNASYRLVIGSVSVDVPAGDATLTRR